MGWDQGHENWKLSKLNSRPMSCAIFSVYDVPKGTGFWLTQKGTFSMWTMKSHKLTLILFLCNPIRRNSLFMLLVKCRQNLYEFDKQTHTELTLVPIFGSQNYPKFIESNDYILLVAQPSPYSVSHDAFSSRSACCVAFSDRDPCPVPSVWNPFDIVFSRNTTRTAV